MVSGQSSGWRKIGDGDGVGVTVATVGVGTGTSREALCAVTQGHNTSGMIKWKTATFIAIQVHVRIAKSLLTDLAIGLGTGTGLILQLIGHTPQPTVRLGVTNASGRD